MINRSRPLKRLFSAFGLALTVSLAIAALSAAGASALSIVNQKGEATGTPGGFFIQGGSPTVSTSGGGTFTCSSVAGSGTFFAGGTTGEATFSLQGCSSGGVPMTTPGQPSGTIRTAKLSSKLVYLNAEKTRFGLLFEPPAATSFAEYKFWGLTFKWTGSLLGEITKPALGVSSNTATLLFEGSAGQQSQQQIEGAGIKYHLTQTVVESGSQQSLALNSGSTLTYPEGMFNKFIP